MKNIKSGAILASVACVMILAVSCFADEGNPGMLKGIEVLTGYSHADLKAPQEDYEMVPLIVDLDFDLKPLLRRVNLDIPMRFEFQLEPFINTVYNPDPNVEIGNAFAFKLGLVPDTWKFQPYMKMALGMLYMTQHTLEQSTQFNFIQFGAFGMHYYLTENIALTAEGRFRHLSNSGIDHPNSGINNTFALAGISYEF